MPCRRARTLCGPAEWQEPAARGRAPRAPLTPGVRKAALQTPADTGREGGDEGGLSVGTGDLLGGQLCRYRRSPVTGLCPRMGEPQGRSIPPP